MIVPLDGDRTAAVDVNHDVPVKFPPLPKSPGLVGSPTPRCAAGKEPVPPRANSHWPPSRRPMS